MGTDQIEPVDRKQETGNRRSKVLRPPSRGRLSRFREQEEPVGKQGPVTRFSCFQRPEVWRGRAAPGHRSDGTLRGAACHCSVVSSTSGTPGLVCCASDVGRSIPAPSTDPGKEAQPVELCSFLYVLRRVLVVDGAKRIRASGFLSPRR